MATTLQEAVDTVISDMNGEDKELVRETAEGDLINFHHGWGMGIRNAFGLWHNAELLKSCGCDDADDASMVIIKSVWKTLRNQTE